MKNFLWATGFTALTLAASGCTSDNLSIDDLRHDEYVRNFIETFGVPDPDHNYAMAKSAGLQVTTKKGGHVTVTAMVGDTEYLFADLDVAPGTTKLPVTIPASVKELIVTTHKGTQHVATDAIVDIDQTPTDVQSRTHYQINDTSNDGYMEFDIITGDGEGDPYLAFYPQNASWDLYNVIKNYFGADGDNTDTEIPAVTDGTANGQNVQYFKDSSHETILTCLGGDFDYYIFPIWWESSTGTYLGDRDYEVYLHKAREGEDDIRGMTRLEFSDPGVSTAKNPFPEIYYTKSNNFGPGNIDVATKSCTKNVTNINGEILQTYNENLSTYYNMGQAYPTSGANMARLVLTRGKKISITRHSEWDENNNRTDYFPAFAIAVKSDIKDDGTFSFVSSAPFYNAQFWGQNYYDVPLNRLYQADVATKRIALPHRTDGEGKPVALYIHDPEIDLTSDYWKNGGDWWKINKSLIFTYADQFLALQVPKLPFLLGFTAPASQPGDTTPRKYNKVVFLVTPHVNKSGISTKVQFAPLPTPLKWTVAAEDLGGSDDWDFNDVVFTFTDVIQNFKSVNKYKNVAIVSGPGFTQSVRVLEVTPRATGGTMPIYITYSAPNVKKIPDFLTEGEIMFSEADAKLKDYLADDSKSESGIFVLGTEVHKWLGADNYTKFVNVGQTRSDVNAKSVQFILPTDYELGDESKIIYTNGVSKENDTLFGFAILVDKDNELNIDTFNDEDKGYRYVPSLELGKESYLIGAPDDNKNVKVPQMILVQGDWEWPSERTNIMDAYPNFKEWVADHTNDSWIMVPDESKVTKK